MHGEVSQHGPGGHRQASLQQPPTSLAYTLLAARFPAPWRAPSPNSCWGGSSPVHVCEYTPSMHTELQDKQPGAAAVALPMDRQHLHAHEHLWGSGPRGTSWALPITSTVRGSWGPHKRPRWARRVAMAPGSLTSWPSLP